METALDYLLTTTTVPLAIWLAAAMIAGRDVLAFGGTGQQGRMAVLQSPSRPAFVLTLVVGALVMVKVAVVVIKLVL